MLLTEKTRYVVVEGPIGAGKTSLARRLAEHFGKDLLLEQPDANPFLPRFYEDPKRHALATQLFFLFQRIQQVADLKRCSSSSDRVSRANNGSLSSRKSATVPRSNNPICLRSATC